MSKPVMTVFAGTNGAGKSTLTKNFNDQLGQIIDPDAIAKEINPRHPESVSPSAGREAIKRVRECIKSGKSFSIETTLAGKNAIRQMEQAKEAGFEINLYYVGLKSVEYHIERVEMRVKNGGHHIPEEDIRRRYDRSIGNLPEALKLSDRSFIFDNTSKFRLIMEVEKGNVQTISKDIPQWVKGAFLRESEKKQKHAHADKSTREEIQKPKMKETDLER
ncbi:putative ABC-type ATPase [Paenibacillus amylolyticus]|uniref:UDP-N-acetylglucosamine kinase n=1 Tax=Paenibacillus amylolyticus TaxID=1451 RepID=A0AAP5LQZ9_PAEAM|nr:zeta toxin family protein [Paenibacillus amylolyticus]MDR6726200.1 putative ABC-type ATPase [Paenibacillus amylolyticus]